MAVILNFPERLTTGHRPNGGIAAGADIVILPCVRRERIGVGALVRDHLDDDRPSQRQA